MAGKHTKTRRKLRTKLSLQAFSPFEQNSQVEALPAVPPAPPPLALSSLSSLIITRATLKPAAHSLTDITTQR